MNMTKFLVEYIANNKIDVSVVSERTGVDIEILQDNPKRELNSTEFLELCAYLKIRPEEIEKNASIPM